MKPMCSIGMPTPIDNSELCSQCLRAKQYSNQWPNSKVVYVVLGGGAVAAGYKALRSAPLMVNFQLNTPALPNIR